MKKIICIILSLIFCLCFASCNVHQNEGTACKDGKHQFVNYRFNDDATCFEDGTETAECENIYCSATHTRVSANSKKDHLINFVEGAASTCCTSGYLDHYACVYCNTLFADELGAQILQREDVYFVIESKPIVPVSEKASTCYSKGYSAHYKCSVCNKTYLDALGEVELDVNTILKPLAPHEYEKHFTTDPHDDEAEARRCVNYVYCGAYTDWRTTNPDNDNWWTPNA